MTENNWKHKTVEERVLEKLEDKGFCTRNVRRPIDMFGGENRFDGRIDGKTRSEDPSESFKIERQGDATYKVVYHSFRHSDTHSGAFYVDMGQTHSRRRRTILHSDIAYTVLTHPYAQKKGIAEALPHVEIKDRIGMGICLSFLSSCPISRNVMSSQEVSISGSKKNAAGTPTEPKKISGSCWAAWANKDGSTGAPDFSWLEQPTLYIAEGPATAYSVWKATSKPCLACFGKGSFSKLTTNLRYKYQGEIIWVLDQGEEGELAKQVALAAEYGVGVTYPILSSGTDFNDLHQTGGLPEVLEQLQINMVLPPKSCDNSLEYYKLGPTEAGRSLKELGFDIDYSNLWLIQGDPNRRSGEFVFSIEDGSVLGSAPKKLKNILIHEGRTAVSKTSDQDHPNGHVFMVRGHGRILNYRPPEPELRDPLWKKAKVTDDARDKATALYRFMVQVFPTCTDQLLMFLKHLVDCPKHPLPFAVIIYGPRGTGKSCFLQLARLIIGPKNASQGSTLTSMMGNHGSDLYVNSFLNTLDEVDLDRVIHWGDAKLKQVITERRVDLNRKFKDIQRGVRVRCNFLWATNEILQASSFSNDRRYVWVPSLEEPLNKAEYKIVGNDILDTYGLKAEKEFDWAPIKAFIEMYINPLTYDEQVINKKNERLVRTATSNPVRDVWDSIDKTPLKDGKFFDLRKIAEKANDTTEFYHSLFYDFKYEEPTPAYNRFIEDIKKVIFNEGLYVIKRARKPGQKRCTGVMKSDTAGSPLNHVMPSLGDDDEEI